MSKPSIGAALALTVSLCGASAVNANPAARTTRAQATTTRVADHALKLGNVGKSCRLKGKRLWGKVQVVTAFPDIKVQVVTAFPDLKVQKVTAFPDRCGKWKFVTAFPDFKIQYVKAFPELKIQFVTAFPGVR